MLRSPCAFQPKGKVLPYSRCLSEAVLSHSRRSRASLGAHYLGRYSLCTCISKCIRSTFTHNVVGTVHIGTDRASIFGAVQAVFPSDSFSAKDVLFLSVGFVARYGVKIKKGTFSVIALVFTFPLHT